MTITRTDAAGAPVGSDDLNVSAPTVGHITTTNYGDYATFDFSGVPVENEVWTISLNNTPYAYTSHAGDSISTVMQNLAGQLANTGVYGVGFGGSQLWVEQPWYFFFFSLFNTTGGSVALGSPTTYGTSSQSDSTSLGVSVALTGIPQNGQTWTLTLDGQPYAYTVNGTMTLPQVAQHLAALLPGSTYAITVVSNVITVYRTTTQSVTASITVSSLGTASNSTSGHTATVEFTGVPVEAELWTVTVDGILFVQLSHSTDTLTTVLNGLAGSITGTMPAYTATVDLSGGRFRLNITHAVASSIAVSTSVMLDTVETQGGAAVSGSGANASIDLAGATPGPNESWTLTVDGVAYVHTVAAGGETAAQVAAALRVLVPSGTYAVCSIGPNPACSSSTLITLHRIDGTPVTAFLDRLDARRRTGDGSGTTITVSLTGEPNQGEIWTLKLGSAPYSYAVLYGDTLATIAARARHVAAARPLQRQRPRPRASRSRARPRTRRLRSLAISPDSQGGARRHAAARLHPTNWNQRQTVPSRAQQRHRRRRRRARLRADDEPRRPDPRPGDHRRRRQRQPEPFLNNPLMLPGETNLPLPDGTLTTPAPTPNGDATITDLTATNVNLLTGERPGFDPRMNDFAYTTQFLSGVATRRSRSTSARSRRTSSRSATTRPSSVSVSQSNNGTYQFIGTPQQSMVDSTNGANHDVSTLTLSSTLKWIEAQLSLTGLPNVGDVWNLVLAELQLRRSRDVDRQRHVHRPAGRRGRVPRCSPARTAARSGLHRRGARRAPRRQPPDHQADRRRLVHGRLQRRRGGRPDRERPWADQRHAAVLVGHELDRRGDPDHRHGRRRHGLDVHGRRARVDGDGRDEGRRRLADDEAGAGLPVRLRRARLRHADHVQDRLARRRARQPARADDRRPVRRRTPSTSNTRVDETTQVDTLNVNNSGSPANDTGVLTDSTLTGLGMGGSTVVGGQVGGGRHHLHRPRGPEHPRSAPGDNTFTIESTHSGTTTVTSGGDKDTIRVKTTGGHTAIDTGAGDDLVTVVERPGARVAARRPPDDRDGRRQRHRHGRRDRASRAERDTITGSTITGLGGATVAEQQTIVVKAASGKYQLLAPGYGVVTLDYADDADAVAAALRLLYGFGDIAVTANRIADRRDVHCGSCFVGMHSGIDSASSSRSELDAERPAGGATITDTADGDRDDRSWGPRRPLSRPRCRRSTTRPTSRSPAAAVGPDVTGHVRRHARRTTTSRC